MKQLLGDIGINFIVGIVFIICGAGIVAGVAALLVCCMWILHFAKMIMP